MIVLVKMGEFDRSKTFGGSVKHIYRYIAAMDFHPHSLSFAQMLLEQINRMIDSRCLGREVPALK